ncbi:MAG: SIMPL domain-containing protein [Nitrososphaeria archaeon]
MNKGQKIVTISILALAIVLISSSLYPILASAPTTDTNIPAEHTISVTGTGDVKVNPDLAIILSSAVTKGNTTNDAVAMNSEILNNLLERLTGIDITKDQIQTTGYNIYPVYEYPKDNSQPYIVGYTVQHNLEVSVNNTDVTQLGVTAGNVIDEAVTAGINQVSGVQFTISEQSLKQLNSQALQLAISEASDKANITAKALDVKIVGIQSACESSPTPNPVFNTVDTKQGQGTTFIPGAVTISTSINIVYIIG